MPGRVQRQGDPNVAGGIIKKGDPSVLINGRPAASPGTSVTPHPPCSPKNFIHCVASTTGGSRSVFVNKKPLLTGSDKDTCSHGRATGGSKDVIVGK
jgi:uncharacterized Zn-binding protein involved in type VI secretion